MQGEVRDSGTHGIVSVIGDGQIYRVLMRSLSEAGFHVRISSDAPETELPQLPNLILVSFDDLDAYRENWALPSGDLLGVPTVVVLGASAAVLVGSPEHSSTDGCIECARIHWQHSVRRLAWLQQVQRLARDGTAYIPLTASTDSLHRFGDLFVSKIRQLVAGTIHVDKVSGVYNAATETMHWKPTLPSHQCEHGAYAHADTAMGALIHLVSRRVVDEIRLRTRLMSEKDLVCRYVHRDVGYISELKVIELTSHIAVSASVVRDDMSLSTGAGHALSKQSATTAAILESLERVCGRLPLGKQTTIYDSYANLRLSAIHPRCFGEHDDDLYDNCEFEFEKFRDEEKYRWVWAHSFARGEAVLVPEQIAYFGAVKKGELRFVYETSNGCAVGASIEEAILHGVFEVIERDLFLNMWYGRIPLPELDVEADSPMEVRAWYAQLSGQGFVIRLFNLSLDLDVPAVLAVAINPQHTAPNLLMAAGCHLNPYQAMTSALRELAVQVASVTKMSADKFAKARTMYADSRNVRSMRQHVLVNALPESFDRAAFIFKHPDGRATVKESYSDWMQQFGVASKDIKPILEAVLTYLHNHGFDVLVVNQTSIELKSGGLSCVKVLVPGMLPMTFGHSRRRVNGLTRVLNLPQQLGIVPHALPISELNPYPHPFA
ncbi:YcaO-like family protein [Alicyclobacillus curvatus]|nr:YcaO-like family protein [Alicyclobacillus curvatus]